MKLTKILLPIVSSAMIATPSLTMMTSCSKDEDAKKLDDYTWDEIKEISKSGEASKYFKIGDTKRVQLKTQDKNGNGKIDDGEFYQTVRIIGFSHDYDYYSKLIGITFEFVDKICDLNGLSLATYWTDFEGEDSNDSLQNLDYTNSYVHSALVGDGTDGKINWFKYYGQAGDRDVNKIYVTPGEEVYHKSVLNMLPDDLKNAITPAAKLVNTYKDIDTKIIFQEQWTTDSLFLLSPIEVGYDDIVHERWCPVYEYYKDHTKQEDTIRIKKQLATEGTAKQERSVTSGKAPEGPTVYKCSFAGCDNTACLCPDWLRTPNDHMAKACAAVIDDNTGRVNAHYVRETACGVAPAFCV